MGLLKFLKKTYIQDYDLENLEDLVYDNEHISEDDDLQDITTDKDSNMDISELFEGFDIDGKDNKKPETEKTYAPDKKTQGRQKQSMLDEEKYDHLLNSVQAQNLIKTVENLGGDSKAKQDIEEKNKEPVILPDVTRKPKKLEKVDTEKFKTSDIELYVKSQCDIMEEAAAHAEAAKDEYESVTEEFNDITLIEEAPDDIRKNIEEIASRIDSMSVDRRIIKASEQKLSNASYRRMEAVEDEMPGGLKLLRAQEEYYDSVKRDMRMVEGERLGLRLEAKDLVKKQIRIRSLAKLALFAFALVFVVFLISIGVSEDDSNIGFFIMVSLLAAILVVGMFAVLKITERKVLITEIKLNKATALLNKIKIKYINAANTLDYEYTKFGVKSAYELGNKYQVYLDMKDEQKRMLDMTSALNQAELKLEQNLKKLGLYNVHVWLGRVRALYNPKEMVEIRHELVVRRQKLRNQIEYNENQIDEAKQNIKNVTLSNPEYSQDAIRVIEMYERRHRVAK